MLREVELYNKIEGYENQLGHVYIRFHERFKNYPAVAKFWSEAALEEMQHGGILRFCREHGSFTAEEIENLTCEHIAELLETVSSVADKSDLTVNEAFYASLLMEASELDEVYSKLTRGLLPNHPLLYESIKANMLSHHARFADAADRFLADPAFVTAFRNLAQKHAD
jgi:hypothetical protein